MAATRQNSVRTSIDRLTEPPGSIGSCERITIRHLLVLRCGEGGQRWSEGNEEKCDKGKKKKKEEKPRSLFLD